MELNKSDLITHKISKVNPDTFLLQCILRLYVRSSLIADHGAASVRFVPEAGITDVSTYQITVEIKLYNKIVFV